MTRAGDDINHKRANAGVWVFLSSTLALTAAIALVLGWPILTALLFAFLLACPLAIVWTYVLSQRPLPLPLGPAPVTRGDVCLFDWIAPWYDSIWCPAFGLGRAFRSRVAELCAFAPGEHVLDVGCGTGWLTRVAADAVGPSGAAWGVDPAPDMIRFAMQTAGCRHCGAHFKLAAVEALPFEDQSFDIAVVSLVLHHLPPDARATGLKEVSRILRTDGRLIVVDIGRSPHGLARALLLPLRLLPNFQKDSHDGVEQLLRAAGFVSVDRIGSWGPWLAIWRARRAR